MTAKEAREISNNYKAPNLTYDAVIKLIKEAAVNGQDFITIFLYQINEEILEKLKNNDYLVLKSIFGLEENEIDIQW